ncbi:MAG TPA: hypothetical protein PLP29_15185 [Candidatus Ozemobacteraceae bacterium]|nr:hypothetical protein [Candidatus Ozemobacteraceae bacterium]
MRLYRNILKSLATTLAVVMLLTSFVTSAEAGLFSTIKDKVKANPVKSALIGVGVAGAAILAAPTIASAVGFAGGAVAAGTGGAVAAVAGAGAGIAGIGTTICGGVAAAGGFLTGTLGGIVGMIGSLFSGIAGFIGGIIGSPLFIPALVVVGAAVAGYFLWKKYKRQKQDIGNGNNLPSSVSASSGVVSVPSSASEIPVSGDQSPVAAAPVSNEAAPVPEVVPEVVPEITSTTASSELKNAHADYIKAYNKYISIVTNIGGSESPDEEMRSNMLRSDTQKALTDYREAYNKYITLLRQSNSK